MGAQVAKQAAKKKLTTTIDERTAGLPKGIRNSILEK
jgi:hypothetical protein